MKRLLFIGTGFYQYDNYVRGEIAKKYEVDYINSKCLEVESPLFYSLTQRFGLQRLFKRKSAQCIQKDISYLRTEYDCVFVIKGEYLTDEHLEYLKHRNPSARFILYLWDAWSRHENQDVLKKHFSHIYSFDAIDCQKYGFELRPLFYIKEPERGILGRKRLINVSFVGGSHSGRLAMLESIKKICTSHNLKYDLRLIVGHLEFWIKRYLKRDYEAYDILTREHVKYDDYIKILDDSIAVIDVPNLLQTGLTIRTIEALSRGAKVVTTNNYIKYYKELPDSLILYIDDKSIDEEKLVKFISTRHDDCLSSYYSLETFIKDIIG